MNDLYFEVFYIEQDNSHQPLLLNNNYVKLLPASGWFDLQTPEGHGWSEWVRDNVHGCEVGFKFQDPIFTQLKGEEGWGSISQRWHECEISARMRLCDKPAPHGVGYYIVQCTDYSNPNSKRVLSWNPHGVGIGSAEFSPFGGW